MWRFLGRVGRLMGINPLTPQERNELLAEHKSKQLAEARLRMEMEDIPQENDENMLPDNAEAAADHGPYEQAELDDDEELMEVDGAEIDGSEFDGYQDDGSELDGSEDDGSKFDGSEDDGSEVDGSEDDASEVDGSENDGSEVNGSKAGTDSEVYKEGNECKRAEGSEAVEDFSLADDRSMESSPIMPHGNDWPGLRRNLLTDFQQCDTD